MAVFDCPVPSNHCSVEVGVLGGWCWAQWFWAISVLHLLGPGESVVQGSQSVVSLVVLAPSGPQFSQL